jgi:Orsellinic acid/F9775 biosynthesis cluster protein D
MPEPNAQSLVDSFICYNTKYRLAICKPCGTVLPKDVATHLRHLHASFDASERQAICEYIKQWELTSPELFYLSLPLNEPIAAIAGLTVHNIARCNTCAFLGSEQTMEVKHCRVEHGWIKSDGNFIESMELTLEPMWAPITAQTLSSNKQQKKYFPVTLNPETGVVATSTVGLIHRTLLLANDQDKTHHLARHDIEHGENSKDTPWLTRTGWKRQFGGQNMSTLAALISLKMREDEIWLQDIQRLTCQVIENCYLGISWNGLSLI